MVGHITNDWDYLGNVKEARKLPRQSVVSEEHDAVERRLRTCVLGLMHKRELSGSNSPMLVPFGLELASPLVGQLRVGQIEAELIANIAGREVPFVPSTNVRKLVLAHFAKRFV